jgi:hypothetical protein
VLPRSCAAARESRWARRRRGADDSCLFVIADRPACGYTPTLTLQEGVNPPVAVAHPDGGNLFDPLPQGGPAQVCGSGSRGWNADWEASERPASRSPGNRGAETPSSPAVEQALELFSDDLLEHFLIQGEVRHQPVQPGILLFQLPELADLRGHQAPMLFLPAVKGLLADTHLAGDLGHLRPLLGLLQDKGNLLVAKPGPLHRENPPCQISHLSKIFSL